MLGRTKLGDCVGGDPQVCLAQDACKFLNDLFLIDPWSLTFEQDFANVGGLVGLSVQTSPWVKMSTLPVAVISCAHAL